MRAQPPRSGGAASRAAGQRSELGWTRDAVPCLRMAEFVHLHVHSHYTLLESPIRPAELLAAARAKGMGAVALTDRANLFGAFEFAAAAKDLNEKADQAAAGAAKPAHLKAIVGCQLNLAPMGMRERGPEMQKTQQLVLLAQDEAGYRNLSKLVSLGWLEGFYYEARVDLEALAPLSQGLICLTGAGRDGYLNAHLQVGAHDEAARRLGLLKDLFADRLYVELTEHGVGAPIDLRASALAVARQVDVPVVATNWVHYLAPEDHRTQDVQLAIQKATTLADTRRKRMPSDQYWLKTPQEMAEAFAGLPEALANSLAIAERCAEKVIPMGHYYLPRFQCPAGEDERSLLGRWCTDGLAKRYGAAVGEEHLSRMAFELETISTMGFEAYFLIVADFIAWAKRNGIPVGPGRGSAAGSLVSYCLGITDICPLRYGLLFERFLNPGRKSMPDIDIDFCKDRRAEVIEYVAAKYGRDAVTQIMTLGTMKARMAIKDVARAFEWTPEEAQELANLIPEDPSGKTDLKVCLGRKPLEKDQYAAVEPLVRRYEGEERTRDVIDAALSLEKLGRSLGVHACGIIIAPGAVSAYVPVCRVKDKPATQYNMNQVEKCGLLKMDFLGLKTMSILKKAADIVRADEGRSIDYPTLPLDDRATYAMLSAGDTLGVFQCESEGFQRLIRQLKPDRFEDMIALVALYRPGPLQAGMDSQYCDRKHGRERVDYPHPVLERSLKETFGLYIYQEQVMSISRELCGFTPAEADDLRKAMGKKDVAILKKLEQKFVEGAWTSHQFPRERCTEMWHKILGFASYCFNKSHSACYGLIAYWTAYMKANHYAAFMTANLIYEMDNKDKMTLFVEELRTKGIPVLPPDINESGWEFTLVRAAEAAAGAGAGARTVRFGLGGIKAVGESAAEQIIARRTQGAFASLYDLCERVDTRVINKRVTESLIKVGAFDSLHPNRRAMLEAQERAFERGARLAKGRTQAQESLFAAFEDDDAFRSQSQGYPEVPDWPVPERLAFEKALTGYWISSHPLGAHAALIARLGLATSRGLAALDDGWKVTLIAVVLAKRVIRTKAGKTMAILSLEDQHGRFEAVLFASRPDRRGQLQPGYEQFAGDCEPDVVALFSGTVSRPTPRGRAAPAAAHGEDGEEEAGAEEHAAGGDGESREAEVAPGLRVSDVVPMRLLGERLGREVVILCDASRHGERELSATELILKEHPGTTAVAAQVWTPDGVAVSLRLGETWRLHPSAEAIEALKAVWGPAHVALKFDEAKLHRPPLRDAHATARAAGLAAGLLMGGG